MVRIKDVADLAKVSTATVSRALSNTDTVSEKTKRKVMEAVERLNYRPNVLARHLRQMQTKTIVVVVPDITNPFFSKVLRGVESIAYEKGYQVLLRNTNDGVDCEHKYLDLLGQRQADGMILLTARLDRNVVEEVAEQFPVVLACEYIEGSSIPTVSIDNISAARKATEHLIKLGHRHIGFITGPMNIVLSRDRLKGYQQAMSQHELEIDSLMIQEGDFTFESGYNLMNKFLALELPPTAIFASNDEMAIGAMKSAKAAGLKIPEDIAVVGFDDIQLASIYEPALTTISQPMYEMGAKATELLLNMINGNEPKKKQLVLQDKLVIRESCSKM